MGSGSVLQVALLLINGERLEIPLPRGREVALLLSDPAQSVICGSFHPPVCMGRGMLGQLCKQAGSLDEIPGVLRIGAERLGQRGEVLVHGEALGETQGKVKVGPVQQEWHALLMVFQWRQLIRKRAHDIDKSTLAGLGSRAARTQVAGEQGMDLMSA